MFKFPTKDLHDYGVVFEISLTSYVLFSPSAAPIKLKDIISLKNAAGSHTIHRPFTTEFLAFK